MSDSNAIKKSELKGSPQISISSYGSDSQYLRFRRDKDSKHPYLAIVQEPSFIKQFDQKNTLVRKKPLLYDVVPLKDKSPFNGLPHVSQELELLYTLLPAGLALVDSEFRFIRVNEKFSLLSGQTIETHIGKTVQEMLPDIGKSIQDHLESVFSAGHLLSNIKIVGRLAVAPQQERTWLMHIAPLRDEESVPAVSMYCEEVTELIKKERTIVDAQNQLEAALQAGSMYIWNWNIQEDLIIVDSHFGRLLGISSQERNDVVPIQKFFSVLHDKDKSYVASAFDAAIRNREPYNVEFRIVGKSGDIKWMIARGKVEYDPEGYPLACTGTIIDITHRINAEEALRQSDARFRRLIESNLIGVILWNVDGRITDANGKFLEMLGYERKDIDEGILRWDTITPPEWREQDKRGLDEISQQGTSGPFEKEFFHKNGSKIAVVLGNALLEGSKQQGISFVLGIVEQKAMEAQKEELLKREKAARESAEQANRFKDEFLTVLSHELRSPLNPILGWTSLLISGRLSEEKKVAALEIIERNAKLQSKLIDDLLDVSRILSGKMILSKASVNLTNVVKAAVETVRLTAEVKKQKLSLEVEVDVYTYGDAARLQQVLVNLLNNAIKFTPSEGRVSIKLSHDLKHAHIKVIDTGKGIRQEFLPHVFDHFRQEDGTITRKFGGLGLGLAIVHQIVESHQGVVYAESEGEDKGAVFTVMLPLSLPVIKLIDKEKTSQTFLLKGTKPLKEVKVLMVDDDPDCCHFGASVLESAGAEVIQSSSVKESFKLLQSKHFDIIVTDIGMPEIDGYTFIRELRLKKDLPNANIPAIALTAYAGGMHEDHALTAGFQQHIAKPVEPEVLVSVVVSLVQNTLNNKRQV
jgi:PAS domain S-box-containing protein